MKNKKNIHFLTGLFSLSLVYAFGQNVGINTTNPIGALHVKGTENTSQLVIDADTIQGNTTPLFKLRNSMGNDLLWIHSDDSTNTFVGQKAGKANVIGPQGINNSFIGSRAGAANTNGRDNTAIGTNALSSNTKGSLNTAIGTNALYTQSFSPGGAWYQSNNVAVGYEALYANQPNNTANGVNNTAIGTVALRNNTVGNNNTASGSGALLSNTYGSNNTANGEGALYFNTAGNENTAIGKGALFSNTWGDNNTASGKDALYFNTYGNYNTASGYQALYANISGSQNTAIGIQAISSNIDGNQNTAIGEDALDLNTTGDYNTACGFQSLENLVGGNSNIAIGAFCGNSPGSPDVFNTISIGNAGYLNAASHQAFIGNLSTLWTGGQTTWFTYASDARVKNEISDDVKGLDFIKLLRPVTYHLDISAMRVITGNKETEDYPGKYDVEKIKQSGFIAQEVEQAAQQANYDFSGITIPKNSQELYTLSYAQFVVPLVKAVQELNTALTTEVADLKSANGHMRSEIDALKVINDSLLHRLEKIESGLKK